MNLSPTIQVLIFSIVSASQLMILIASQITEFAVSTAKTILRTIQTVGSSATASLMEHSIIFQVILFALINLIQLCNVLIDEIVCHVSETAASPRCSPTFHKLAKSVSAALKFVPGSFLPALLLDHEFFHHEMKNQTR